MIDLNVCRLCLSDEGLLGVYDKNIDCESEKEFHEIVFHTSGVRILIQDLVTKKICKKCRDLINSVWRFRKNSIKTDIYLREKLEKYLRDGTLQIPHTDTFLKCTEEVTTSLPKKKRCSVHPSVSEILQANPRMKLPPQYRNVNFAPFVSMDLFHVEQLFQEQNLSMRCTLKLDPKVPDALPILITSCETVTNLTDINHTENNVSETKHQKRFVTDEPMVIDDDDDEDEPKMNTHNISPLINHKVIVEPTISPPEVMNFEIPESIQLQMTKEEETYICDICAFVVDNPTTEKIKRHRKTHALRCKYCRKGYVGAKLLNHHMENRCHYRKALVNNPVVLVRKVDKSPKWRKKYPDAFKEIIKRPSAKKSSSTKSVNKPALEDKTKQKTPYNKRPKSSEPPTKKDIPSTTSSNSNKRTEEKTPKSKKSSTSIINPRIGIENNNLLDRLEPNAKDIDVIRTLVKQTTGIKISYDKTAQTDAEPVRSAQIRGNEVVLKNIKPDLRNQIPVRIKHGTLSAKYSQEEEPKIEKRPQLSWAHMLPIHVVQVEEISLNSILGDKAPYNQSVSSIRPLSRYAQGRSTSKDMPLIDNSIRPPPAPEIIDLVGPEPRPTAINYTLPKGQVLSSNGQESVASSTPSPQPGGIRVRTIWELCN